MDIAVLNRSEKGPRPVILLSCGTLVTVVLLLGAITQGAWGPDPGISASILAALLLLVVQIVAVLLPRKWTKRIMRFALVLPLVALVDLLDCERAVTVAAAASIAPLLAGAFFITTPAWIFLDRFAAAHRHRIATTLGLAPLPMVIVGFTYLILGMCAELGNDALRQVLFVGLAVSYANLGAAIAADHRRLDAGLVLRDGRRLLGDGKTVRGTLGGLALAALVVIPAGISPLLGLYVGLFTLLGDAAASVLKRRFHLPPGELTPLLDQWDSLIPLFLAERLWGVLGLSADAALILVLGVLFIQLYGNTILFLLGRKPEPW